MGLNVNMFGPGHLHTVIHQMSVCEVCELYCSLGREPVMVVERGVSHLVVLGVCARGRLCARGKLCARGRLWARGRRMIRGRLCAME